MPHVRTRVQTFSDLTGPTPPWSPQGDRETKLVSSPERRSRPTQSAPLNRLARTVWERNQVATLAYRGFVTLGTALGKLGISANALTYTSLLLGVVAFGFAARGQFWLAAFSVFAGGVLDALDGIVARTTGTTSRYGALLDSTVDRVTDALPLLGVLLFYGSSLPLSLITALALVGSIVIPYARARAEALGAKLPTLFMRRPERIVLLVACFLLGEVELGLGLPAPLLAAGVAVLAVLSAAGAISVLRAARTALNASDGPELPLRN
jgi:CDP-diacylglycerol---glycerol-3-phosphate 3-phosphatidyltransferase